MKQQMIRITKLPSVTALFFVFIHYNSFAQKSAMDLAKAKLLAGNAVPMDDRETGELSQAKIADAVHASNVMLEFYTDPMLPY